ncbi:dehydrogenase/reductase SDR family member 7B-like isoform X3 [Mytilus trossulus]|uniref:dehydrogenase/reductase SDR family member 7B-like isoform X3 n=1 Tax=Mytilus trossulus TaxID=6551 RepID=UPI0030047257
MRSPPCFGNHLRTPFEISASVSSHVQGAKFYCMIMSLTTIGSYIGFPLGFLVFLYMMISYKKRKNIQGKVVLITGANSGLGKECAKAFHQAKCRVLLCGRNREALQALKEELTNAKVPSTHQAEIVVLDLEKLSSIPQCIADAVRIHGHIDIVINNAGLSYRGQIEDTSLDVDIKLMTVNYFAQIALIKAVLPYMKSQQNGSIVNISSIQGKFAIPYRSALMDKTTQSGMAPSYVAEKILSAVEFEQNEVILSPVHHKIAIYLRTIVPNLFFKLMKSRAKSGKKDYEKKD